MLEHLLGHAISHLTEKRLTADALARDATEDATGGWMLVYSRFFAVFWLMQGMFWSLVGGAFLVLASARVLEWQVGLAGFPFSVFGAFGLLSFRDALFQRLRVTKEGAQELWAGQARAYIPWSAVRDVRFVTYLDAYAVKSQDGTVIQVSRHIRGLSALKRCLLWHAPDGALHRVRARFLEDDKA